MGRLLLDLNEIVAGCRRLVHDPVDRAAGR
jgi:hypothetical protein